MNQTMSSTSEWMHLFNHSFSGQPVHPPGGSDHHHLTSSPPIFGDRVSDATVVTTAVPTTTTATGSSSPTAAASLSPDGRVSKPARKRSRASRRTPTTLLNTDTSNFRAMVQQFTGGPTGAPFGSISHPTGGMTFGFGGGRGGGGRQNFINPTMVPPAGFPIQHHQLFQQQNPQYLQFGLSNGGGGGSSTPAVDGFLQRLSLGGGVGGGGIGSEGYLNSNNHNMEDSQMVATASRPSSSSNENTSNSSFMF